MKIECWRTAGGHQGHKDVIRLRRLSAAERDGLRAALSTVRAGEGDALIYELERGFSPAVRVAARLVVGLGIVVVMLAGVGAFLAPGSAGVLLSIGMAPAAALVGVVAALGYRVDIGFSVFADGRLRRVGWDGIRDRNVREYQRVTLGSGREEV